MTGAETTIAQDDATTTSSLAQPLLSENGSNNQDPLKLPQSKSNMKAVDWPETEVVLHLPKEWQSDTAPTKCFFQYDAEQNLLKLVYHGSRHGEVIDILDPEDVIGVEIVVNSILDAATPPRATSPTTSDNDDNDRPANAPPTDTLTDTQGQAILTIYAYPREDPHHPPSSKSSSLLRWCGLGGAPAHPDPHPTYQRPSEIKDWGNRFAFHRRLPVVPAEDVGPLNALVKAIQQAAGLAEQHKRGRALVVVNPKSGPQIAEQVYDNVVNVLLEQAHIEHDLFVTKHAQHAMERMAKGYGGERDLMEYTALVTVGGDGIFHECLQGIRQREDAQEILQSITVSIIGAGSSNGMAKSIARHSHEQSAVLDATFLMAKNYTNTTDLSEYQTTTKSYWSFLTYSWAWVASIDIDSEFLRTVGSMRFDLWGAWCLLKWKTYHGKLSYLPPGSASGSNSGAMPPLTDNITDTDWVTEEDDYVVIWASHVPDAADRTYHSPPSRLDDGVFQIQVIRARHVSRLSMVKILLGWETGSHASVPGVEFIKCTAFRLEPTSGINDLDGEVIEDGPVQAKVMPAALKIFCK